MKYIPHYISPVCCDSGKKDVAGEIFVDFGGSPSPETPYPMRWFVGGDYRPRERIQIAHCPWCAFKLPETMDQFDA